MGETAREQAMSLFDPRRMVEAHAALYRRVLDAS